MQSVPQTIALMSFAACLAYLIPPAGQSRLSMARYATGTATEIRPPAGFEPSPNQHLPAGRN